MADALNALELRMLNEHAEHDKTRKLLSDTEANLERQMIKYQDALDDLWDPCGACGHVLTHDQSGRLRCEVCELNAVIEGLKTRLGKDRRPEYSGKPDVGDVVSFYSDGRIIWGKVEYVAKSNYLSGWQVMTTAGARDADSILEVRREAIWVKSKE